MNMLATATEVAEKTSDWPQTVFGCVMLICMCAVFIFALKEM